MCEENQINVIIHSILFVSHIGNAFSVTSSKAHIELHHPLLAGPKYVSVKEGDYHPPIKEVCTMLTILLKPLLTEVLKSLEPTVFLDPKCSALT